MTLLKLIYAVAARHVNGARHFEFYSCIRFNACFWNKNHEKNIHIHKPVQTAHALRRLALSPSLLPIGFDGGSAASVMLIFATSPAGGTTQIPKRREGT
jgi:hypothetical protein